MYYSATAFAGIKSVIVVTRDLVAFQICIHLLLPCVDESEAFMMFAKQFRSIASSKEALYTDKTRYRAVVWFNLHCVLQLLKMNFSAVHFSDIDISYGPKDMLLSYKTLLDRSHADIAFMAEIGNIGVNTGNYMVRLDSTGRVISILEKWLARGSFNSSTVQVTFNSLIHLLWKFCYNPAVCSNIRDTGLLAVIKYPLIGKFGVHLTFGSICNGVPGQFLTCRGGCFVVNDICNEYVLFVHAICTIGAFAKQRVLFTAGFWFLEEYCMAVDTRSNNISKMNAAEYAGLVVESGVPVILCHPRHVQLTWSCNLAWQSGFETQTWKNMEMYNK
jgi:hypothetical protein